MNNIVKKSKAYQFFINKHGRKICVPPGWKGIFDNAFEADGFREYHFIKLNPDAPQNKILIERNTGGLGDILMILPAIKTLIKENPLLDITISFPGQYAWMFRELPITFIDCYVFCQDYLRNIKQYGKLVDLECPYIDYKASVDWKPKKNRIEIFAETLDVKPKIPILKRNNKHLDVRFLNSDKKLVGLILEVADHSRPYPLDRWIKVALSLRDKGFRPVTIARDKSLVDIEYIVGIGIERLVTIIDQMDIIVTADTGPLHIAGALSKPIVALFGPTNGALICKLYKDTTVIQKLKGATTCYRPCYINMANDYCCGDLGYSTCMYEITADEVVDAVLSKS